MRKPNLEDNDVSSLLIDIDEDVLQFHTYQGETLSCIDTHGKEFKNCMLENINFNECLFDNSYFIDVVFKNCDISNIHFSSCLFRRVSFENCKCLGADFNESLFDDVSLKDCQCGFMNLSFMKNKHVSFNHCEFNDASFLEVQFNKTTFDDCSFMRCEFQHSTLYHIDLSSCQLMGILISPQDIQGAIIDNYQASSLIHLLGIQIKEY